MSEQQELRKRSHTWTWVAVVVALLLPVLYVLSIGPVFGVLAHDPLCRTPDWYHYTYGPLERLASDAHCDDWLNDYKSWWLNKVIVWNG